MNATSDHHFPGDMPPQEFRRALHEAADAVANYLEHGSRYPVLPPIRPGQVAEKLPSLPPESGEPIERLLADYREFIEPNVTHWNHPGFMAYFAITGSGPGIIGELLTAGLNVNAMLWHTGPAPTELEQRVCDWLRGMIGLPEGFDGHINDTASIGTLLALAAARERALAGHDLRRLGLAGRGELPPLTVYCSDQAHSSVDKAVLTLGLGLDHLRRLPSDADYRLCPDTLRQALRDDISAGRRPIAVVATLGTTSTNAIDPLPEMLAIVQEANGAGHGADSPIWMHADAAYGGSAAICPEYRTLFPGLEACDSVVVNPHKWLFTPVDCSVLLTRHPETLRRAFSIVPEYLRTSEADVVNLMDYGMQLGRRFRALKLWFVIRYFGLEGLRARIRGHCALASEFAAWVDADPGFERLAPVPLATVCFRAIAPGLSPQALDALNERILAKVNADGRIFLSHTVLSGRYTLRLTVGNLRTTRETVGAAWEALQAARAAVLGE